MKITRTDGAGLTLYFWALGLILLCIATDGITTAGVFLVTLAIAAEIQRKANQILDVIDPEDK